MLPVLSRFAAVAACAIAIACVGLAACQSSQRSPSTASSTSTSSSNGCIDRFDPAVDYFPAKSTVESAEGFSVSYHKSYKVVTVGHAYQNGPAERYVLVQCGAPRPALTGELASATVVSIPVSSLFAASVTQLPMLVDLDRLDVLTGVSTFDFIVSPEVLARIKTGAVTAFAPSSVVDAEIVVSKKPGLLMTGGGQSPALAGIRAAGIPVVSNVEWLESTALGRAEWIKYVGLFLNEEEKANARFTDLRNAYQRLVERTSKIPDAERPLVMTGRATHGNYVIAGGRSYVARLISDAGGRYVWADNTSTGTSTIDLEAQMKRAGDADVWINGGGWTDLAAMIKDEPRYARFKAYQRGQVWVYEKRQNERGANDYWSRGITRPDLILADLIKIFHPDLLPEHELEWYMQVPRQAPR